ncbi:MAG: c-type cytochrome [Solirubrobacteraceae bacterium]
MILRARLALLAITGTLAGCGATSGARGPNGKSLFAQDCSACHSLSGRESPRRQGGDLLGARLSPGVMLQFAREMPVRRPLSRAELKAVTDYVISLQRRGR